MKKLAEKLLSFNSDSSVIGLENDHTTLNILAEISTNKKYLKEIDCKIGYFNSSFLPKPTIDDFAPCVWSDSEKCDLLPCYIHVSDENPEHRKIMMMNGEKAIERYNNSYIMNYVYNDNTFRLLSDKWFFKAFMFKRGGKDIECAIVDLGYDKDLDATHAKTTEGYQNLNYIDKNGNLISPHINFEIIDPGYLTHGNAFTDNTITFNKYEYGIAANRYKNFKKYKKIFYDNIKQSVEVELNKECFKQIIGPKYAKEYSNEYIINMAKHFSHAYLFKNGDIALFVNHQHPYEKVFYYVKQSKNAGYAINEKLLTFNTDSSVIGDTDSIEAIKKAFDENYYIKKYKISTIHPKDQSQLNEILSAVEYEEAEKQNGTIKSISSLEELKLDLNWIDVSNVKDMSYLFFNAQNMNYDISKWDVSNVVNMKAMFYGCEHFNCDISNWDVSNVKDMCYMFQYCKSFNRNISNWNVSNVKQMRSMFQDCIQFNQDLSNWDVSNVNDMFYMFKGCKSIMFDVQKWHVPKVCIVSYMFLDASPKMQQKRPTKHTKKVNEKLLSFTNDSSVISDDSFGGAIEIGRNKKRFEDWHIEYGMARHKGVQFKDESFLPVYTKDPDVLESNIKMWQPDSSSRYKFSEDTPECAANYIINDGSYRFLTPYWFDYVYVFTDHIVHMYMSEESAVVFRHAEGINSPAEGLYNFIDSRGEFISPKIWFKGVDCPFSDNSRIYAGKKLILRDKKYKDYIDKYAQDSALVRLINSDLKEYLPDYDNLKDLHINLNIISILYRNGDILLILSDIDTFEPVNIIKQTNKDIKDTYNNLQEKLLSFSSDSSTIDLEKDNTLVDLRDAVFVKNRLDWLKKNTDYVDEYKFMHNTDFNYTDPATRMAPGISLVNSLRYRGLMQIYTTDIPEATVFKNPNSLPFMNFVKTDGSYKLISDIWFSTWRSPNNYTPGAKLKNQGCLGFYSTRANRIVQACISEDILKDIICFVFIYKPRSGVTATFIDFFGLITTDGKLYKIYNAKTNEVYFDYASFRRECIENEEDTIYEMPPKNPWDSALTGKPDDVKKTSNLNTFYIKEVSGVEMSYLKAHYSIKALFKDTSYDALQNNVEMNEKLLTFSTDSSIIDDSEHRDSKDVANVLLKNEFDKRYVDVNADEFYSSEDDKYIEFDFSGRHMRKCKTKNAKISYESMLAKEPDEINVSRAYNFYDTETYEIIFPYFCVSNAYGSSIWRGSLFRDEKNILWNSTSKNNKYIEKRNYIKMLVGNSSDSRELGKYYYFFIDEDYEIILITMYYTLPQSPAMNYEYCEQMHLNLNARDPNISEKLRELVLSGTLDENIFKSLYLVD